MLAVGLLAACALALLPPRKRSGDAVAANAQTASSNHASHAGVGLLRNEWSKNCDDAGPTAHPSSEVRRAVLTARSSVTAALAECSPEERYAVMTECIGLAVDVVRVSMMQSFRLLVKKSSAGMRTSMSFSTCVGEPRNRNSTIETARWQDHRNSFDTLQSSQVLALLRKIPGPWASAHEAIAQQCCNEHSARRAPATRINSRHVRRCTFAFSSSNLAMAP